MKDSRPSLSLRVNDWSSIYKAEYVASFCDCRSWKISTTRVAMIPSLALMIFSLLGWLAVELVVGKE